MNYEPNKFEKKWQDKWVEDKLYKAVDFDDKPKYYALVEFPYPSGDGLHIGHSRNYSMMDAIARLRRMMGYNVLYPMGWDAFGLPAELYALKNKKHPRETTDSNSANFKRQMISLGLSFDWDREVDTTDPKYYRWTQWIFTKLFEKGLANKVSRPISWCPSCNVGCANEEVVDGKHERCETVVDKKDVTQWELKITDYADRLADELDLVDYPNSVVASQRNWIGRKNWIDIKYKVEGSDEEVIVSTTRPDTNFGATFVVVAPEHSMLEKINHLIPKENVKEVQEYIAQALKKTDLERQIEGKDKTGVFTGVYVVNSINGSRMPIYITDFVLMNVGTGAVVGVPGHDMRDFEFAKKFDLPVIRVVVGSDGDKSEITEKSQVQEEEGIMINSGFLDGMNIHDATEKMMDHMEKEGMGERTVRYKLKDWGFSRQTYWGEPIPIVHCDKCGPVAVPEDQLPLELPIIDRSEISSKENSPLAKLEDWVNTECPNCNGPAKREVDVMPNWAGSSWYFLRYCDPMNTEKLGDMSKLKYWMPIDIYDGGSEHTTLHLLYSRFWHKFLNDIGAAPGKEPYAARRVHGFVLGEDGRKMSKSLGNVLNPDDVIVKYGSDATRAYLMFMGPYSADNSWNTRAVQGVARFLDKYFRLVTEGWDNTVEEVDGDVEVGINKLTKKVQEDLLDFKFNTSIAAMMEFVNTYVKSEFTKDQLERLMKIIAPVAPHLAEEAWAITGHEYSVHKQEYPNIDESMLQEDVVEIGIQINGKVRGRVSIAVDADEEIARKAVEEDADVQAHLDGKNIKKFVYVPGRIINIVV